MDQGTFLLVVFGGVAATVMVLGHLLLRRLENRKIARMSPEERGAYLAKEVEERKQRITENKRVAIQLFGMSCLVAVAVGLCFACCGGLRSLRHEEPTTGDGTTGQPRHQNTFATDPGDKEMAIIQAEHFVEDRLKSPSSASFSSSHTTSLSSDGVWSVSGNVEAVNSFNARIRASWSVKVKKEGRSWLLLYISID